MSLELLPKKISQYSKLIGNNLLQLAKSAPDLIIEFKSSIVVITIWILISETSGYRMIDIFRSIFRLILYPLNWVLYRTNFDLTGIPVIFILLMPLVILISVTFILLISTEDWVKDNMHFYSFHLLVCTLTVSTFWIDGLESTEDRLLRFKYSLRHITNWEINPNRIKK